MSIGRVVAYWGEDQHTFDLQPLRWLRELQEKTGVGPFKLLLALKSGDWKVDEVRHVLRIGLLGGMEKPDDAAAGKIMAVQFDNRPIMDSLPLAIAVLAAGLFGGSEPTKKAAAEADSVATTDESPSQNSTAVAPS